MEDDDGGGAGALRGVRVIGKVAMTRREHKCSYIPLVKLARFLTKLKEGEGVLVTVETSQFSVESVAALAKAYEADAEVVSSHGNLVTVLIRK